MNKPRTELMCPAGAYPALASAIRAGADSVYFGVGELNMRARAAHPFTLNDLGRIARICRWCGVRSYLALNTIMYDEDIPLMRDICAQAKDAGVSAVIASDIAAIEFARSLDLEVHMSVQANISNLSAVKYYARYADVVVLARELTLEQVRRICDGIREENICGPGGTLLRVELFVHGALCVAISGKCGMSLATYNQSASRGACFQPCRRRYEVTDVETGAAFQVDNQFIMSPRDLCTIHVLDQILDAGVSILKIEGRGRTANYVRTVTEAYRETLDERAAGTFSRDRAEARMEQLEKVFNRGFWKGGYYLGEKLGEWSDKDNSQATHRRVQIGAVSNYFAKPGVAEFTLKQPELRVGDELLIEGPKTGALEETIRELRIDGVPADEAHKDDVVTVPVNRKVRRKDKVFVLKPL